MDVPVLDDPVAQLVAALAPISLQPQDLDGVADSLRCDPGRVTLVDLGLDSLGRLEACIALEIDQAVLISPETVDLLHSADRLLQRSAAAPRV